MRLSLPLLLAAGAAIVVVAAAAVVGHPAAAHGDTVVADSVITVGHGSVTVVPDRATITAGVHTQAASARAALAENAKRMNDVVAALKAAGGENLQTQQVSLSPQTNANGDVQGYAADDSVSADSAIAEAGALVDAAVTAGANTVDGPELSVSDRDAAYRQALAGAVGDAHAKADALGKAGGFVVGVVSSVVEQQPDEPAPVFGAAVAKSAATPIEAGTEDVTADVTVTFRIE
jgi:uncharacterized protein YggE